MNTKNNELLERLWWLIRLRWIAATGVWFVVFFTYNFLNIYIPAASLYSISLVLGIYNFAFVQWFNRLKKKADADISRESIFLLRFRFLSIL